MKPNYLMMKRLGFIIVILLTSIFSSPAQKTLHDFKATTLEGEPFDFAQLKGKKVLIVNTASKCSFTPQYKELEKLYTTYTNKNFIIIGFPSNDFGKQEPGTAKEIREFCTVNFGITFPLMEKVHVKGKEIHPIYQWLTNKQENGKEDVPVIWNFQKFMINEEGHWIDFLPPGKNPDSPKLIQWIEGQ